MKLLYLWISEDENKVLVNQGFNLGGKYYFQYQLENNTIEIQNKKNYIEDFYNMSDNPKYGVKDITAIVGGNGSGKSTILNLIKNRFSDGNIFEFEKSTLSSGFILVIEDEDTKLMSIFYGESISKKSRVGIKSDIQHKIHDEKVTVLENNKLNILRKKYNVQKGNYGFSNTQIDELNNMQTIYFSNVVDSFSGGNTIVSKDTKMYDISTNGLIENDIKNINIYSNANVPEAISRKLNISQLEVFKKYENIRMFNFLAGNIEFDIPFRMPNEIILEMFDFRTYHYELKEEYGIIHKAKQEIKSKTMINKVGYHKRLLSISIVIFLIQGIIDIIPYIREKDYEFLMDESLNMEIDYYSIDYERNIYSEEYSFEEEVGMFKKIYSKITEGLLSKYNNKQKKLALEFKENASIVWKLYNENKKIYEDEIREIRDNIKELEECGIKEFYYQLGKQWRKIEEFIEELCLSKSIEKEITNYLETKILEALEKDSCESITELIDGIGSLIQNNYNEKYLNHTGTIDAIYNPKFFNLEIYKLKKLVGILWKSIDEDSGKLTFKLDNDKDQIKEFIDSYKQSNIIYKLCQIKYRNISSGEKAFLNICSRFYSIKNDIDGSKDTCRSILVLIDEVDLYFHPQWQKELIYNLSHLLSKIYENRKVQIILSSHSPFVLSDIQKCNIVFMDKDSNGKCTVCKGMEEEKETFAANIHTLFTDSFFVKNGLIGKLANEKIRKAIDILTSSEGFKNDEERESTKKLIYSIEEALIRNKLVNMYKQKVDINSKEQIEGLKEEMKSLAERIKNLESKDK